MTQAKPGSLLIEVRGDPSQVEAVRAEISRQAGVGTDVRSLQQRTTIVIKDLDEWSTKEEVTSTLLASHWTDGVLFRVASFRRQYRRNQVVWLRALRRIRKRQLVLDALE